MFFTKKFKWLSETDLIRNANIYDQFFQMGMKNGWLPGNQNENFTIMLRIADYADSTLAGKSCLDVGCGTADLSAVLRQNGIKKYTGIDIYRPSLNIARANYPAEHFIQGDILQNHIKTNYDFVFCSGALSLNMQGDNYVFLEAMIKRMWSLTRTGLVFNFLTPELLKDPDIFEYDTERVLELCRRLAPKAEIISEETPHKAQEHIFMWRPSNQRY